MLYESIQPPLASLIDRVLAIPPLYLCLWALLAVLTVVLAVLMRTPWGQARPTHRYVLLSVVAHLALICLATTVRFMSAPAGEESTAPVKVRIVMRQPPQATQDLKQPVEPQPVVEQSVEPLVPQPDPTPAETSEPQESAPVDAPADVSVAEPIQEVPQPVLDERLPEPIEKPLDPPPLSPAPELTSQQPDTPSEQMVEPLPVQPPIQPEKLQANADSNPLEPFPAEVVPEPFEPFPPQAIAEPVTADKPPSPYSVREIDERLKIVEREGGSRATEDAVAAALAWLASAQSRDGRWDASSWNAGRETHALGHNRRGAGAQADTGVTGLAMLALMGAGHNPTDGPYAANLRAGAIFLMQSQTADGSLGGQAALYAHTYCHSMATFALAETLAVTDDPQLASALRQAVRRAVDFLAARQDPAGGGWRYEAGVPGDMSQMGWIIMALRSAELSNIDVTPGVWTNIERFIRATQRGRNGGLACYQPRGATSRTMTAESLYCRQILGWRTAGTGASAEAVNHVLGSLPGQGRANYYYWYYASLALHHHRTSDQAAAQAWRAWNSAMSRTLVSTQVSEGVLAGSWNPNSIWGGYGGRVYSTAMATMCLEVYYRYDADEVARDPWVAARPATRLR